MYSKLTLSLVLSLVDVESYVTLVIIIGLNMFLVFKLMKIGISPS